MPPNTQTHRQDAMQAYMSDKGDDENDGLSPEAPVKSLKRLCVLSSDRQMVVFARLVKAESKNENRPGGNF